MTPDRLDQLIQALFDGTLDDTTRGELNSLLLGSKDARDRYRRAVALHSALSRRGGAEPAGQKIIPIPARRPFFLKIAAVAAVAFLGAGTALWFHKLPRATLAASSGADWAGSIHLSADEKLPASTPLELRRGIAEISYPSGARVTLEGPCRFQLDKAESLTVNHGRVSVHAPPGAQGFRVDTPGGRFTDLGTRFGLAIGSDGENPVILTEVYEGEVRVDAVAGKPKLYRGDARALLGDPGNKQLVSFLDAEPVTVPRIITPSAAHGVNLALGKPVTSPGYCIRPHGSVFPPQNLTDGRTDDTGVPGDWSFWLAPNGENGEFTVDLETVQTISRLSLQNTANRRIDDRGTASFQACVSTDNEHFTPIVDGQLPRIDVHAPGPFPFHDFTFPATRARYVKVVVTGHYRHPARAADHENQGGGLNEIRIFSE